MKIQFKPLLFVRSLPFFVGIILFFCPPLLANNPRAPVATELGNSNQNSNSNSGSSAGSANFDPKTCSATLENWIKDDSESRFFGLLKSRASSCELFASNLQSLRTPRQLQEYYQMQLSPSLGDSANFPNRCNLENSAKPKVAVAKFFYSMDRMQVGSAKLIEQIAAIDTILPENQMFKDFNCDNIFKNAQKCESYKKSCGSKNSDGQSGELNEDEFTEFSRKVKSASEDLLDLKLLEGRCQNVRQGYFGDQNDQATKEILSSYRYSPGDKRIALLETFGNQRYIKKYLNLFNDNLEELKKQPNNAQLRQIIARNISSICNQQQISENKSKILAQFPFIEGDHFKSTIMRNQTYGGNTLEDVKIAIRTQLKQNRDQLIRYYSDISDSTHCLLGSIPFQNEEDIIHAKAGVIGKRQVMDPRCEPRKLNETLLNTPQLADVYTKDKVENEARQMALSQACRVEASNDRDQTADSLNDSAFNAALTVGTAGIAVAAQGLNLGSKVLLAARFTGNAKILGPGAMFIADATYAYQSLGAARETCSPQFQKANLAYSDPEIMDSCPSPNNSVSQAVYEADSCLQNLAGLALDAAPVLVAARPALAAFKKLQSSTPSTPAAVTPAAPQSVASNLPSPAEPSLLRSIDPRRASYRSQVEDIDGVLVRSRRTGVGTIDRAPKPRHSNPKMSAVYHQQFDLLLREATKKRYTLAYDATRSTSSPGQYGYPPKIIIGPDTSYEELANFLKKLESRKERSVISSAALLDSSRLARTEATMLNDLKKRGIRVEEETSMGNYLDYDLENGFVRVREVGANGSRSPFTQRLFRPTSFPPPGTNRSPNVRFYEHPDFPAYRERIRRLGGEILFDSTHGSMGAGAYFSPDGNYLGTSPDNSWNTFIHEFQHLEYQHFVKNTGLFEILRTVPARSTVDQVFPASTIESLGRKRAERFLALIKRGLNSLSINETLSTLEEIDNLGWRVFTPFGGVQYAAARTYGLDYQIQFLSGIPAAQRTAEQSRALIRARAEKAAAQVAGFLPLTVGTASIAGATIYYNSETGETIVARPDANGNPANLEFYKKQESK